MLADSVSLLLRLTQQAFLDHKCDVLTRDPNLLEPISNPTHRIRCARETRIVEERFLHASDEAEPRGTADLADLAEKLEVQDQLDVLA
jgi:hypothetical protein